MKTLFVGDIAVDIVMAGLESLPRVNREICCDSFEITMGGSTVISASAYASLGGKAWFHGLAGEDQYGDFMLKGMREQGINTELVQRTHRSKTGITICLAHEQTRTQITYLGTVAEFDASQLSDTSLKEFDHLHVGGPYMQKKLLPQVARILEMAKAQGMTTSLDPQWDPTEAWNHIDKWYPLLTYFFVNEAEAQSLSGSKYTEESCEILGGKTACPVIKAGELGAFFLMKNKVERIPGFKAKVIDTTGAGDTFNAAFLFGSLEQKMPVARAISFANAAAARSCGYVGGINAKSRFHEVVQFMEDNQ